MARLTIFFQGFSSSAFSSKFYRHVPLVHAPARSKKEADIYTYKFLFELTTYSSGRLYTANVF